MKKKEIFFEFDDFNILEDISNEQFAIVEIFVCHDGNNAHDLPISLETLKRASTTLKNKPLLASWSGYDFKAHEPRGGDYKKNQIPVGVFPESSEIKYVKKNDKTYLVATAIMYKLYAEWAYKIFKDKNEKSVSMEIRVVDSKENEDGTNEILDFVFSGVTILGDNYNPACEGSNAQIIKFSKESALEVYNRHFVKSIKQKYVDKMSDGFSGKEDLEAMEEEKNIEVQPGDTTYMEENKDENLESTPTENEETFKEDDKKEEEKETETVEEEKEFSSLTQGQKRELLNKSFKELNDDNYVEDFDDSNVYVSNWEECKTYRIPYSFNEGKASFDFEKREEVIRTYMLISEVKFGEEENKEKDLKIEELEKQVFSLNETIGKYEELKKTEIVESIISEVINVFSSERVEEIREESKEYTLENINVLENSVKAEAFEKMKDKKEVKSFSRYAFGDIDTSKSKTSKYSW